MAWIPAFGTNWALTPPNPYNARDLVTATQYIPISATVQWNVNTNIQRFIPAPGYSDLVNVNPVSYAG